MPFVFKWTSHSETGTKSPRGLVWWLLLILGVVVAVAGAIGLWIVLDVTLHGIPTTARVIEHHPAAGGGRMASIVAQVEVAVPSGPAFHKEVEDQFGVVDWVDGGTVNLVCAKLATGHPICGVDSVLDLWLQPVVFLVVGLALVWWWWSWWRRRLNT